MSVRNNAKVENNDNHDIQSSVKKGQRIKTWLIKFHASHAPVSDANTFEPGFCLPSLK